MDTGGTWESYSMSNGSRMRLMVSRNACAKWRRLGRNQITDACVCPWILGFRGAVLWCEVTKPGLVGRESMVIASYLHSWRGSFRGGYLLRTASWSISWNELDEFYGLPTLGMVWTNSGALCFSRRSSPALSLVRHPSSRRLIATAHAFYSLGQLGYFRGYTDG